MLSQIYASIWQRFTATNEATPIKLSTFVGLMIVMETVFFIDCLFPKQLKENVIWLQFEQLLAYSYTYIVSELITHSHTYTLRAMRVLKSSLLTGV